MQLQSIKVVQKMQINNNLTNNLIHDNISKQLNEGEIKMKTLEKSATEILKENGLPYENSTCAIVVDNVSEYAENLLSNLREKEGLRTRIIDCSTSDGVLDLIDESLSKIGMTQALVVTNIYKLRVIMNHINNFVKQLREQEKIIIFIQSKQCDDSDKAILDLTTQGNTSGIFED